MFVLFQCGGVLYVVWLVWVAGKRLLAETKLFDTSLASRIGPRHLTLPILISGIVRHLHVSDFLLLASVRFKLLLLGLHRVD